MSRRNAITITPGLRELYGEDSSSGKTDEELAAEEQAGEIEVEFSAAVYDDLRGHGRYCPVLADTALAYQDHGLPGLLRYITRTLGRRVGVVTGGGIPRVIYVGRRQASSSEVNPGVKTVVAGGPAVAVQLARALDPTIIEHPRGTARSLP